MEQLKGMKILISETRCSAGPPLLERMLAYLPHLVKVEVRLWVL